jgi:hypothetical protein
MTAQIIDFKKKRAENIEKKKRQFERVLFSEFVQCYTVVPGTEGLFSVQVIDVSQSGCQLHVEVQENVDKLFKTKKELDLRFFFTKKSFLNTRVQVKRLSKEEIGGKMVYKVGCEFDQSTPSYQAIKAMVGFFYQYAEYSQTESAQNRVFFL